jgi:hypothetical protein
LWDAISITVAYPWQPQPLAQLLFHVALHEMLDFVDSHASTTSESAERGPSDHPGIFMQLRDFLFELCA